MDLFYSSSFRICTPPLCFAKTTANKKVRDGPLGSWEAAVVCEVPSQQGAFSSSQQPSESSSSSGGGDWVGVQRCRKDGWDTAYRVDRNLAL